MTGGEPIINRRHQELLEFFVQTGDAKHITLQYNSNRGFLPEKTLNLWKEFKGIGMGCSIDGIGQVAEYPRPPIKWRTIERNIERLDKTGIESNISVTVSIFNILHITELIDWIISKQFTNIKTIPRFHFLYAPEWYSAQILPKKSKEIICRKYDEYLKNSNFPIPLKKKVFDLLQSCKEFLLAADHQELIPKFIEETSKLDEIRKTDIYKYMPEVMYWVRL